MRSVRIMLAASAFALFGLPAAASAHDATAIASCPYTIARPGHYVVAADLVCPAGGISIESSYVLLDLQGHSLIGAGASAGIAAEDVHDVLVRGPGTVTAFLDGLSWDDVDHARATGLTATGNVAAGFALGGGSVADLVDGVDASENGERGFVLDGASAVALVGDTADRNGVSGVTFAHGEKNAFVHGEASTNGDSGIDSTPTAREGVFYANTTDANGGFGIHVESGSTRNAIVRNDAHLNGGFDLADDNSGCDSNLWRDNSFDTASQPQCMG